MIAHKDYINIMAEITRRMHRHELAIDPDTLCRLQLIILEQVRRHPDDVKEALK